MHRPSPARIIFISGFRPSSSIIICVASTMVSIFTVPGCRWFSFSSTSNNLTRVVTCSGIVTLGSIMTKFSGRCPLVCSSSVVRKISNVLTPRCFRSSVNGFMRIPMKGEIVLCLMPFANSFAAAIAVASSSASGLLPKPSSKSMRKSSTGSVVSLAMILL